MSESLDIINNKDFEGIDKIINALWGSDTNEPVETTNPPKTLNLTNIPQSKLQYVQRKLIESRDLATYNYNPNNASNLTAPDIFDFEGYIAYLNSTLNTSTKSNSTTSTNSYEILSQNELNRLSFSTASTSTNITANTSMLYAKLIHLALYMAKMNERVSKLEYLYSCNVFHNLVAYDIENPKIFSYYNTNYVTITNGNINVYKANNPIVNVDFFGPDGPGMMDITIFNNTTNLYNTIMYFFNQQETFTQTILTAPFKNIGLIYGSVGNIFILYNSTYTFDNVPIENLPNNSATLSNYNYRIVELHIQRQTNKIDVSITNQYKLSLLDRETLFCISLRFLIVGFNNNQLVAIHADNSNNYKDKSLQPLNIKTPIAIGGFAASLYYAVIKYIDNSNNEDIKVFSINFDDDFTMTINEVDYEFPYFDKILVQMDATLDYIISLIDYKSKVVKICTLSMNDTIDNLNFTDFYNMTDKTIESIAFTNGAQDNERIAYLSYGTGIIKKVYTIQ